MEQNTEQPESMISIISSIQNSPPPCAHESHNSESFLTPLPTSHFRDLLESQSSCNSSALEINKSLNEVFVRRLEEIDECNEEDTSTEVKLITFQEWVDSLLKCNEKLIYNTVNLEKEVLKRIEALELESKSMGNNHVKQQPIKGDLKKYQNDILALLQLIREVYYGGNWNIKERKFETFKLEEILQPNNDAEVKNIEAKRKQISNVKALAMEVAQKHDEIIELKRKINLLEEDNQKAQQKMQLMDTVIKQFRDKNNSNKSKIIME